ncbi:hypothetical protein HC928_02195 [bacterium]|nr:hypothetical protein [bacterium]
MMYVLEYRVTLLEPVLVTGLDGDPNSAVALDYLPGSAIRGAIIGRYLQTGQSIDAGDPIARRIFFSPDTLYLNAYPMLGEERTLPAPRAWHKEKGKEDHIVDLALSDKAPQMQQPKALREGFVQVMDEVQVRLVQPARHIAIHTQRERRKGRATEQEGAVYRYDALAPQQRFAGAIICNDREDASWLHDLLKEAQELQLGGARTAGYGRTRLDGMGLFEQPWQEAPSHFSPGDPLIVTLLSDAILRNAQGEIAPDSDTLQVALATALQVPPAQVGQVRQAFLGQTMVGGFNRKWGLPLPQMAALAMGSVLVLEGHHLSSQNVENLIRWGIGERREEGFGRVGVNIFSTSTYTTQAKAKPAQLSSNPAFLGTRELPEHIARRELQRRLEIRLIETANTTKVRQPPHKSQVYGLRAVVQTCLQDPKLSIGPLEDALDYLENRNVTRRQFEKASIEGQPMISWIKEALKDDLSGDNLDVLLARLSAKDREQERVRYNLRLIDAVLARAAKPAHGKKQARNGA